MLIDETIYAGKRVKQFVGYDGGVGEGGQEDRDPGLSLQSDTPASTLNVVD